MITDGIINLIFAVYRTIKRKIMGKDIEDNKLKVGFITKTYLQMKSYEIKFRCRDEYVLAKMLQKTYGDNTDFYIPEGEKCYSKTYDQNYIVPKEKISCIFVKLDKNEYVVLGFYDSSN